MWFRKNKETGVEVPDIRAPKYEEESAAVQLRIMRTHVAAQASELSSLLVLVQKIDQKTSDHMGVQEAILESLEATRSRLDKWMAVRM